MISCLHTITKLSAKNAQRLQRQIHQFYLNDRGKHAETYAKTHAKDKVRGSNASAKQNRKEKGSRTTLASSPLPREVSLLGWRLILSRFYLPGVQRSTENTKNHSSPLNFPLSSLVKLITRYDLARALSVIIVHH